MKKILNSLPFKLLLGVAVGIVLGLVANEAVMNVVVTVKQVLGQIITFCVPLIVIGFIALSHRPSPSWATTHPECWAWRLLSRMYRRSARR